MQIDHFTLLQRHLLVSLSSLPSFIVSMTFFSHCHSFSSISYLSLFPLSPNSGFWCCNEKHAPRPFDCLFATLIGLALTRHKEAQGCNENSGVYSLSLLETNSRDNSSLNLNPDSIWIRSKWNPTTIIWNKPNKKLKTQQSGSNKPQIEFGFVWIQNVQWSI